MLTKKAFHLYNIIFFLLLLSFNLLALFGAGMSQGGIYAYMWFGVGASLVIWILFYILQFIRTPKSWRVSWFLAMVVFLFFWQTGLGYRVGLWLYS